LTLLLNKDTLFSTFNASSFDKLEASFSTIAPSMVEYYLDNLSQTSATNLYINRSNIQSTIYIHKYSLHCDYNDDIYLEFQESNNDEYETLSLW